MRGQTFKRDLTGNSFTTRVVHTRNELPEKVVEAGTVTTFRKHLGRYNKDLKG